MCMSITSGLGRIIFGYIGDFPSVSKIVMHQVGIVLKKVVTVVMIQWYDCRLSDRIFLGRSAYNALNCDSELHVDFGNFRWSGIV